MFYANYLSLCNSIDKSPSAVAVELGLQKAAVTRWKKGGNPTDATAQKIAQYFGVSVDYLLGNEKAPTTNDERDITNDDIKIALFGGDGEVTDEMWEEAQFAAQLIKERYKRKKENDD